MQTCTTAHPNDTTDDDYDLYAAITAKAMKCQPLKIKYNHVKGHQDHNKEKPLTIPEAHNVECDSTAKNYVQKCNLQSTTLTHPEFEAAQPHLLIEGRVVCWCVTTMLRQAAAAPAYWDYMQKRYHWSQADINEIQWPVLASALNSFPINDQ